ncbi:uncharacterized protein G2W53_014295 [Senna tora]|uniref:Uncharacterized protein n=1 Tax=Senna tora TaxID=362788 RepID=A0A835C7S0_9FABA|nr:uncharacterized protein G2W53_014295 [Senna tora]
MESSWHGKSKRPLRITRQETCCASESNTSVCVVFAIKSGFDAPIPVDMAWEERGSCVNIFRMTNRVDMAWEERGSCLNIFWTTNRDRISETFTNYEAKDLFRKSVDHVLAYFGRQIVVGSQKPSRITRQKTCCASDLNMSVRVVFSNRSGFDAPIGVVMAWEDRGSCLNIFRTTNRCRISETFTNYEAKDLLSMSVDHVLTYSERQIVVGSQTPSRITRQKTCCACESNTSVRVVFANRSGFDAPIGVVLAWDERGSCLNIFRMTNRDRVSKTFTNYEAKDLLRIRILETFTNYEAKDFFPSESNTSVRVVFVNRSSFDALIRDVLEWEERGSCLNIFRTQITIGSQKPSRITRQKTCCASESNTSVRVVFANRSGFDAPIGVVLAWEEHGSCLNIFQTTNRSRISETFTNYEAKDLLRNRFGMGGAWVMSYPILDEKSRSNLRYLYELRGKRLVMRASETCQFELYLRTGVDLMLQLESTWHGRSLDHVLTYFGRQIAVGPQKPS